MGGSSAGALLMGTLSIGALHALIPSHWLAFALVGRAQQWPKASILSLAALAGAGHILLTIVLGLILAAAGKAALHSIPPILEHTIIALVLIGLGLYFAWSDLGHRGKGHAHSHGLGCHHHDMEETEGAGPRRGMPTAMGALVLGMTLSPCVDLLPIYVAASALSWGMILALSLVMACVTLSLMLTLVWLALHGLERLNLRWLEHNESLAVGGILIALGALLFFL